MSAEPNDKKHLTPRQIINRYCKGEYVDESIESISSAISSCGEVFDSVAIAFPTTLVQKIVENLSTAQTLYERQKEGKPIDDIVIEDYPYLKDILMDLSYPPLWETMMKDRKDNAFMDILKERQWACKYRHADTSTTTTISFITSLYSRDIDKTELSSSTFEIVLRLML